MTTITLDASKHKQHMMESVASKHKNRCSDPLTLLYGKKKHFE